jgi:N-acetylmuramoyl-L-alanine amidase
VLGPGAALLVLLLAVPLRARQPRSQAWARSQFLSAAHLAQMLEARPRRELGRADYLEVITAYRRVYLECPTSAKADPSVFAVAQLMEEMGRHFEDEEVLRAAIQQYQFLRRQYPGSQSRFAALFDIGEIYQELHERTRAEQTFQEFLRRYPRNQFAEEARNQLAQLAAKPEPRRSAHSEEDVSSDAGDGSENHAEDPPRQTNASRGPWARVRGIRLWPTREGTGVAIDLEGSAKYDCQRIDHPDRVFFDLFDTLLDPELLGKNIDVPQGPVKRIRVSQFRPHQTRIVFEVDRDADFQTRFLSTPPRLVVELRNRQAATRLAKASSGAQAKETRSQPPSVAGGTIDAPDSRAAGKPEDQAAADSTSLAKALGLKTCSGDDPHSSPCLAGDGSAANTATVTGNGVKKTVVEADDDDLPQPAIDKVDPSKVPPSVDVAPALPAAKGSFGFRTQKDGSRNRLVAREAKPMASGDRSLTRVLGLKIGKIVIDPGHGGRDTGTIGPHGLEEKELVLEVGMRLGKLLASRLGAQVIYTRSDDSFIPLETRTAIANREGADLFISIHANSSQDPDARGVETYYLNFTSSREALEVAARENAVSEKSIHELQDLVKTIALKEKIEESREFAVDVDHSLLTGLRLKNPGLRDRGVKKAPFIVLIGANMPSILAEVSFLSNAADERRLRTAEYRQRIAESLYRGIAKYVSGLSGVKLASRMEKAGTP